MFTIIGADQKQYGPVSADDVRQWIREGRADGRTLALAEGGAEWKPLAAFPEFAEALASAPGAAIPPFGAAQGTGAGRVATAEELAQGDYELDIFDCVRRGWNFVTQNIGPVVGITVLVMVAQFVVNQIISMISSPSMEYMIQHRTVTAGGVALFFVTSILVAPFQAVLMGGLYRYYLKLMRGQRADIADAFSGFTQGLGQLIAVGLMVDVVVLLGCLFCVLPGIYVSVALVFAMPLVADRGMDWSEAMKLSLKMVNKHWFVVFGLVVVVGLVSLCGVAVCCVGVLFTVPVALASLLYAYEDIFGRQAR